MVTEGNVSFNLGTLIGMKGQALFKEKFSIPATDFLTHGFICGSTGSGKTVLGKIIVEEAAKNGIPSVLIDVKGDLSSLAIPLCSLNPDEIGPWVEAKSERERREKSRKVIKEYHRHYQEEKVSISELKDFRDRIEVEIYTPKSQVGEPFCISLLSNPPADIEKLYRSKKEEVLNLANMNAKLIMSRLYSEDQLSAMVEETAMLEELIVYMWRNKIQHEGKAGLIELINLLVTPPFSQIGALSVEDFLPESRRMKLVRRINALLIGADGLWYEGENISKILEDIEDKPEGKTKIAIFNLSFLNTFEDRNLVLSQIAHAVSAWMRKKINSEPRLLFYLDEIGSGQQSFFPEDPLQCSSKTALNMLLRQGRAFGVCCLLSTQNPGDIDYKGLTNCHTWFIGKLLTKQDRMKVMEGISSFEVVSDQFENFVKTSEVGQFAVKMKSGEINHFQERWLRSFHKVVTEMEFPILTEAVKFRKYCRKGQKLVAAGRVEEALEYYDSLLQERPDITKILVEKAMTLEKVSRYREALDSLEKAVSLESYNDNIWYRKGLLHKVLGQDDQALECFNKTVELNDIKVEAWYEKSLLHYRKGQFKEAEESLTRTVRYRSDFAEAWNLRGLVYQKTGNYKKSEENFTRALSIDPENVAALNNKGYLYLELKNYYSALDCFEQAVKKDKNNVEALLGLAFTHRKLSAFVKAVRYLYRATRYHPEVARTWYEKGLLCYDLEKWEKALGCFRKAIERDPGLVDAYYYAALCQRRLDRADLGLTLLNQALELNSNRPDIWYEKGLLLEEKGQAEEALACVTRATELDGNYESAWVARGRILHKMDRNESAIEAFSRVLDLNPENEYIWWEKGKLLEKLGKDEEALKCYEKIEKMAETSDELWYRMGKLQAGQKKLEAALKSFRQAVKIKSSVLDYWLEMGMIYCQLRRFEDALDCYDVVVKKAPEHSEAWYQRGVTFKAMNENSKAEYCFEQAEKFKTKKLETGEQIAG